MLIASIFTNAFGIFLFLFIIWKRLKDDFASEIIFKLAFNILAGIGLGLFISRQLAPVYFFWLALTGGIGGLTISVYKLRVRFYETLEAFIIASYPWLAVIFLFNSVVKSSFSSFAGFISILIIIFLSYWIDNHYKNFRWFKSGKIGISGIITLGIVFALRFGLALAGIGVLSFVSRFEALFSGIGLVGCGLLLYNLNKIKE